MNDVSMKLTMSVAVAGVIAVTAVSPAAAGNHGKEGEWRGKMHQVMFSDLDADSDGRLTQDELASANQVWLSKNDADGDGSLSKEELQAAMMRMVSETAQRMADRMFERQDDNGDGLISVDELDRMKTGSRMFSRLDSDDDGMISESEFNAAGDKRGGGRHRDRKHRD